MSKNKQEDQKRTELKEKLKKFEKPSSSGQLSAGERKILGMALRLGLEIIIALGVGCGIGYFIDKFFNTKPIFLILFALFGIAAGLLNVYRVLHGQEMRVGRADKKKENTQDH